MALPKLLLQLDIDRHPSSFDGVVAYDAGVDHLLSYGEVTPENGVPLVHGAMFTRGGSGLRGTAIFIGGSQVAPAELILNRVLDTFFGPVRVSVMFDANGCNTTAAAAVLCAMRHVSLAGATAVVLAGTGPVGMRVARMLASAGCHVRVVSREGARAQKAVHQIGQFVPRTLLSPHAAANPQSTAEVLHGANLLFACGAAGTRLLDAAALADASSITVAVDLNAVPPEGVEGIRVTDAGREAQGRILYGAIGVGGLKMKIHKAAIGKLFEANDLVLDADEIFAIGQSLESGAPTPLKDRPA